MISAPGISAYDEDSRGQNDRSRGRGKDFDDRSRGRGDRDRSRGRDVYDDRDRGRDRDYDDRRRGRDDRYPSRGRDKSRGRDRSRGRDYNDDRDRGRDRDYDARRRDRDDRDRKRDYRDDRDDRGGGRRGGGDDYPDQSQKAARQGTIRRFYSARGFGFIKQDVGSDDIYFHIRNCLCDEQDLHEDDRVSFKVRFNHRNSKEEAVDVRAGNEPPGDEDDYHGRGGGDNDKRDGSRDRDDRGRDRDDRGRDDDRPRERSRAGDLDRDRYQSRGREYDDDNEGGQWKAGKDNNDPLDGNDEVGREKMGSPSKRSDEKEGEAGGQEAAMKPGEELDAEKQALRQADAETRAGEAVLEIEKEEAANIKIDG